MILIYIFVSLAVLIHIYIFTMESLTWGSPRTNKAFGMTKETAEANKLFAFNQGFYNLFLAVACIVGLFSIGGADNYWNGIGTGLLYAGLGSMFGASIILFVSSRKMLRAALIQGLPPLLSILTLLFFTTT